MNPALNKKVPHGRALAPILKPLTISLGILLLPLVLNTTPLQGQEEANKKAGAADDRMVQVSQASRPSPVLPTPQETYWGRGSFQIGSRDKYGCAIEMAGNADGASLIPSEFRKRIERRFKVSFNSSLPGVRFIFALNTSEVPSVEPTLAEKLHTLGAEGYVVSTVDAPQGQEVLVVGNSSDALWHGMATAFQLISRQDDALVFPRLEVIDYPSMSDRGLLVDVGGQGFMVGPSRWEYSQWQEFIDWMVDHKLNALWLEFIGSGRLMGNLDMNAGQWVGYPVDLKSYPQLVARDRPIKRWDEAQGKVVDDTYTAPNVKHEFVGQLIDYAQARGVKCQLQIGYDYFANQLPVVLGVPANDPLNPEANKVYDALLRETVERYKNASGVLLITIENKDVPPTMLNQVIKRTRDGYNIIRAINPHMEVGLLADWLEWRPLEEVATLKRGLPSDVSLAYSPHRQPQQKSWKRIHGDVWRYGNYTQYAWDHVAYIFPEQIRQEITGCICDGYRKICTQAWYFDVFSINYLAMAEYSWNATSGPTGEFWDKAMSSTFGDAAKGFMRTALEHTRFDRRFDIVARFIARSDMEQPLAFWDMYVMTTMDHLSETALKEMQTDAEQSLAAARQALPLVSADTREMVDITIVSAERRLYLATSAQHLLKALNLKKTGDLAGARTEMDECIAEGKKMQAVATHLGIEYPLATHDDKVVQKYEQIRSGLKADGSSANPPAR